MKDINLILVFLSLLISGLFSAILCLGDINANEVLSSTETKDGVVNSADMAVDGDPSTCAKTGFQKGAWMKMKLGSSQQINTIDIRGYMPKYTQIRVGDDSDEEGFRDGFFDNGPCILQTDVATNPIAGTVQDHRFDCEVPRVGSVISFRSGDIDASAQLVLCNLLLS